MSRTLPPATRYVVHIGRHKTGTSSLQRALHAQSDQLAERGIHYVAAGRDPNQLGEPTMIAHHALAKEFQSGELGPIVDALVAETRNRPGVFVISSEALQNIAPRELSRVFPVDETVVVTYLREQVSYLMSAYAQRVQASDYAAPFAAFIELHINQLDYVPRVEALVEEFGPERVVARPYDRSHLTGGNTVTDFYSMLGAGLAPPPGDGNPSINANTVLVKRLMNVLDLEQLDGLYPKLPGLSVGLGGSRHVAISAQRQREIRDRFAEPNRTLFATYFGDPTGSFTLNDYAREETTYTADDVVALVETAWVELGRRE